MTQMAPPQARRRTPLAAAALLWLGSWATPAGGQVTGTLPLYASCTPVADFSSVMQATGYGSNRAASDAASTGNMAALSSATLRVGFFGLDPDRSPPQLGVDNNFVRVLPGAMQALTSFKQLHPGQALHVSASDLTG